MSRADLPTARRPKLLEVIVTSLAEAIEAERGGADRLELTRTLSLGGLTPSYDLVRNVLGSVGIPVRVMLRSTPDFEPGTVASFGRLCDQAHSLAELGIDGLVAGFANQQGIDLASLRQLCSAAPSLKVTFHRAFDAINDRFAALGQLRRIPQIDRILTKGHDGSLEQRKQSLLRLQESAGAGITILAGGGLDASLLSYLAEEDALKEFHVGRAARIPACNFGAVRRTRVAALKSLLV